MCARFINYDSKILANLVLNFFKIFDNVSSQSSLELFRYRLIDFIDRGHKLVLLARAIDGSYFDKAFAHYYLEDRDCNNIPLRFIFIKVHHVFTITKLLTDNGKEFSQIT